MLADTSFVEKLSDKDVYKRCKISERNVDISMSMNLNPQMAENIADIYHLYSEEIDRRISKGLISYDDLDELEEWFEDLKEEEKWKV